MGPGSVNTNSRPGLLNAKWGPVPANTNWGTGPVNANQEPGPVNTNWGPGPLNANWEPGSDRGPSKGPGTGKYKYPYLFHFDHLLYAKRTASNSSSTPNGNVSTNCNWVQNFGSYIKSKHTTTLSIFICRNIYAKLLS